MRDLYKNESIKNWVLFYDFKNKRDVNKIIDQLIKSTGRYNMKITDPILTVELPRRIRASDLPKLYEHKV